MIAAVLLAAAWRAPAARRWPYLVGTLTSALFVVIVTPFVEEIGSHPIWTGPTIPVLGTARRDARGARERALPGAAARGRRARLRGLRAAPRSRPAARPARAGPAARRWPSRSRRASCRCSSAMRATSVSLCAAAASSSRPVRLLSPLLAGSLERGLNVAEAMEARGYGRPGRTRAPRPPWTGLDRVAVLGRGVRSSWWRCGSSRRRRPLASPTSRAAPVLDDVSLELGRGRARRAARAVGLREVDAPARARRARPALPRRRLRRARRRRRCSTRARREPARLAGTVASVFQDPEDQVVMAEVANEVAFGLENVGDRAGRDLAAGRRGARARRRRAPRRASDRRAVRRASCSASASRRRSRCARSCCCSTSRRRSSTPTRPRRSSTSIERLPCAVLVSEQRPARPLDARRPRPLHGRAAASSLDAPRDEAIAWLAERTGRSTCRTRRDVACRAARRLASPTATRSVLDGVSLEVRRGEIVALDRPERRRQDDAGARSPPGCSSRTRVEVEHAPRRVPRPGSRTAPRHRARARRGRARRRSGPRARARSRSSASPATSDRHPRDLSVGRARAARARGGARDRARAARARRADAWRRPGAQGGARRAAAVRGAAARHDRRHARSALGRRGRRPGRRAAVREGVRV